MERPDEVHLSRQDGEALLKRLQDDALTAQDRRVLAQVLQWYFWLVFALQEARFSLKRCAHWCLATGRRSARSSRPQGAALRVAVTQEGRGQLRQRRPGRRPTTPARSHRQASGAQGMVVRELKPTAEPTTWSVVMRPWLLASAARSVGGGACIASRPGSRCVSTATRYCRQCGLP